MTNGWELDKDVIASSFPPHAMKPASCFGRCSTFTNCSHRKCSLNSPQELLQQTWRIKCRSIKVPRDKLCNNFFYNWGNNLDDDPKTQCILTKYDGRVIQVRGLIFFSNLRIVNSWFIFKHSVNFHEPDSESWCQLVHILWHLYLSPRGLVADIKRWESMRQ